MGALVNSSAKLLLFLSTFRSHVDVVQYITILQCSGFQKCNFMFYFAGSSPAATPYTGLVPIWLRTRLAKPSLAIRTSANCPKWTPCAAGCINCIITAAVEAFLISACKRRRAVFKLVPFPSSCEHKAIYNTVTAVFFLGASDPQQYKSRKNILFSFDRNIMSLLYYVICILSNYYHYYYY